MLGITFTLLGTVIGSFLNVCIDRLPEGGSILTPASRCDTCGHRLSPQAMIPIFSYLVIRGKCRHCKASIPLRNLLVEFGTGALFGLIWLRFPSSTTTIFVAIYSAIMIVILAIDLEHHRVLNRLTYPAILLALIASPFTPGRSLSQMLLGGVVGFGILLLIALIYSAGMGMGDVKLMAFIGLVVGYPEVLLVLFLSFVLGGLISGVLWMARVIGRRDHIAFAPFLAAGAIITMLYGEQIIIWWSGRI